MKGQCKAYDVKESGNGFSMGMQCGQGKVIRGGHHRELHPRERAQLFRCGEIRSDGDGQDHDNPQDDRNEVACGAMQEEMIAEPLPNVMLHSSRERLPDQLPAR
jgi:hypothetical protein